MVESTAETCRARRGAGAGRGRRKGGGKAGVEGDCSRSSFLGGNGKGEWFEAEGIQVQVEEVARLGEDEAEEGGLAC